MDEIIALLNLLNPMSNALQDYWRLVLKVKSAKKEELLIKGNRVNDNVYFVSKGWLRSYYVSLEGKEISFRFIGPRETFTSFENFLGISRGYEYIESLEDVEMYYVTYQELQYIYKTFPEFNVISRIVLERYVASMNLRLFMLQLPKAIQRYHYLQQYTPELLKHVPNKYLASYLGITEQSLSRLRKQTKPGNSH